MMGQLTGQFSECSNIPACTLGVGGAKKVFLTLGRLTRCRSTAHAWHPHGPMDWQEPPGLLCPDHDCEQRHAAGEPQPEPAQPQQLGSGRSSESPAQAALRLRFDQQEWREQTN
jgi:hypothetical protein